MNINSSLSLLNDLNATTEASMAVIVSDLRQQMENIQAQVQMLQTAVSENSPAMGGSDSSDSYKGVAIAALVFALLACVMAVGCSYAAARFFFERQLEVNAHTHTNTHNHTHTQ
eukprot:Colp12_sorted_trinity150504_noHs@16998